MTGSTIPHNDNLDVLRGIAVLGVLYHHLLAHTRLSMPFLGHYGRLLGVQLFSLISGYLISKARRPALCPPIYCAASYASSRYTGWRL